MENSYVQSGLSESNIGIDYFDFRAQGMQLLEKIAGDVWTDYNEHDPGITVLEQFCYALSDLSYRIEYDVQDLLSSNGVDSYESIYTAEQILPTSPVTILDLRKLIIDIPGVNNAWVDIVDEETVFLDTERGEIRNVSWEMTRNKQDSSQNTSLVRINGLMQIRIDSSVVDTGIILREAVQRLHQYRGLGQDYSSIELIDHQPIGLNIRLAISSVEDLSEFLVSIYKAIDSYMSPAIKSYSLEEMLNRGYEIDEIFDGPKLKYGFIDSEDLADTEIRSSVRISDLIQVLMSVPGVLAVKTLNFHDSTIQEWIRSIEGGKSPKFDPSLSTIILDKDEMQISNQKIIDKAKDIYTTQVQIYQQNISQAQSTENELSMLQGRDRNVENYISIQEQFPRVYGIGPAGLPASASIERQTQAGQLKAYLMFYDQLLANQHSQLANVGKLFSYHDETSSSYFSQQVNDEAGKLGLDAIRYDCSDSALQQLTEGDKRTAIMRRNRFLDHLLARLGEQFHNYTLIQTSSSDDDISIKEQLIEFKRAYLRDYPKISRNRGIAFNYLEMQNDENISGLELAMRRKFGMQLEEERFYLIEHILLRPLNGDKDQHATMLKTTAITDPYSLQISLVFPDWPECYSHRGFVEQTIHEMTPAHLDINIVWKNKDEMSVFKTAYNNWLQQLKVQRCNQFRI